VAVPFGVDLGKKALTFGRVWVIMCVPEVAGCFLL
jgi:hypothetical protein